MGTTFTTTHLGQPGFSGAPLDFLHYLASLIPEGSKMTIEPKRIVEEGDQVWVWSVVKGAGPSDKQSVDM